MDRFQRLTAALFLLAACVFLLGQAHAQTTQPATRTYSAASSQWQSGCAGGQCCNVTTLGGLFSSPAGACAEMKARLESACASPATGATSASVTQGGCVGNGGGQWWTVSLTGGAYGASVSTQDVYPFVQSTAPGCVAPAVNNPGGSGATACVTYSCPPSWSLSGDTCTIANQCAAAAANNVSSGEMDWQRPAGGGIAATVCDTVGPYGACEVVPTGAIICINTTCFSDNGRYTGQTCADAPPPGPTPEAPAPPPDERNCQRQGLCAGSVNGSTVCLPCSSTPTPTPTAGSGSSTTTTTNPDGSGTRTETRVTEITECPGGRCTTTTTTTTTVTPVMNGTPTGPGVTTTTTTTRPGPGNPSRPGTGGNGPGGEGEGPESGFGGSCSGNVGSYTCTGDAIQCAMAQEQHRRNCEMLGDPSGRTGFDRAQALASYNENAKALAPNSTLVTALESRDVSTLNTTDRIAAGSNTLGITSIALPGGTFTMDLTWLDALVRAFGLIILGASLLIAARIILGGI